MQKSNISAKSEKTSANYTPIINDIYTSIINDDTSIINDIYTSIMDNGYDCLKDNRKFSSTK